ncbi:amidohydrolase 3 [Marasmius fiardii PR-910]|nr:amidohydrolase 3 [Marasmius fiardii PR-910]
MPDKFHQKYWQETVTITRNYTTCSRRSKSIYTVDPSNSVVECVFVRGTKFVAIGDLDEVKVHRKFYPWMKNIKYIPKDSIIIPGLSDSHAHILEYGKTAQLALEGTETVDETVALVREYILSNPDLLRDKSRVIFGGGWDHMSWLTRKFPTAEDLDSDPIISGRRVVLQSKDCHALWVSAAALDTCGEIPSDIEGGIVIRDVNSKPTGVLLDNAQELLKLPPPTEDEIRLRFLATVKNALAYGLTSIHDAGLDPMSLEFFEREAEREKSLPIRIYAMKHFDEQETYWGNTTTPYTGAANGRLGARSVKIFADGALRTGGAALHHHYHDNPSTNGFMRMSENVLKNVIPQFLKDGWQVNVHAIGDRANGLVLDAFESALKGRNVTLLRPRLEHAQILTRNDMERLGRLGVIASVQPTHAISDMSYAEDRLGPERVNQLYAFRSIVDSGARIALGTDFPVEDMNPFKTFYAAIRRATVNGESPHGPGGWFPEQCLTREETLRGMTIDPAYASFTESTLGSIEPTKLADFVVLSQNIMAVPVERIMETKVLATVIDGKPVHGAL